MTERFRTLFEKYVNEYWPEKETSNIISNYNETWTLEKIGVDSLDIFCLVKKIEEDYNIYFNSDEMFLFEYNRTLLEINDICENKSKI